MSLNKDRRRLYYKNVKNFVNSRGKEVRFNLPARLERKEELAKDVKLLEMLKYCPEKKPDVSWVRCETLGRDKDDIALSFPSDGNFWSFVFSDRWRSSSSLRITDGELLNCLLDILHYWAKEDQVKTYKIARFDWLEQKVRGGMQKKTTDQGTKTKAAKITFTYYAINDNRRSPPVEVPEVDVYSKMKVVASCPTIPDFSVTTQEPELQIPQFIGIQEAMSDGRLPEASGDVGPSLPVINTSDVGPSLPVVANTVAPQQPLNFLNPTGNLRASGGSIRRIKSAKSMMGIRLYMSKKKLPYRMLSNNQGYEMTEEVSWTDVKKLKLPPVSVTESEACFHRNVDEERAKMAEDGEDVDIKPGNHCRVKSHPVMTDPTEHVILSDDEDEEHELSLSSAKEMTRSAHKNLQHYLKSHHRQIKLAKCRSQELSSAISVAETLKHKTLGPSKSALPSRQLPQEPLSSLLFLRGRTAPEKVRPRPVESMRFQDDDPETCTCAPGLPRCKSGGREEAEGGRARREEGDRPGREEGDRPGREDGDRPGREVGDRPGREEDTVRSWCVPLTHEQKYRLELLGEDRPTIPPLQTSRLDPRHSITRMRRIERHAGIRKSIPRPSPWRQTLMEMLDAFLQDTYIPKMKQMLEQEAPKTQRSAIKLKVNRVKRKRNTKSKNSVPSRQNTGGPNTDTDALFPKDAGLFPKDADALFPKDAGLFPEDADGLFPKPQTPALNREHLRRALQDFVVRKEQVTIEEGWETRKPETITTITINKKLQLTYGDPGCIQTTCAGEGRVDRVVVHQ